MSCRIFILDHKVTKQRPYEKIGKYVVPFRDSIGSLRIDSIKLTFSHFATVLLSWQPRE